MDNGNSLSASDVMALAGNRQDSFGGVGGFILLFIFLIALGGNGFGFGGNTGAALGLADIQASLYNQTQDANSRTLQAGQAAITDAVLTGKYDNALMMKDASTQLSNSITGISNQISNQTNTILAAINQRTIDDLRDKLATTRDALSNANQTAILTNAINNQTNEILNAQGRYYLNPPCYQGWCTCQASSGTTTTNG